jgi:hypothetical protein
VDEGLEEDPWFSFSLSFSSALLAFDYIEIPEAVEVPIADDEGKAPDKGVVDRGLVYPT